MTIRTIIVPALFVAFAAMGAGCANNTAAERDGLLQQNEDLKRQLDAERHRADSAEHLASAAAADNTQVAPPVVTPPDNTIGSPMDLTGPGPGRVGVRTPVQAADPTSHTNAAGEVVIELSGDVLFDSGQATLKTASLKSLDTIAATLKSKYGSNQIRIEGYSDPTPIKSGHWDDNYDLAFVRARAVMKYLASKGVKDMYAASFGDSNLKSAKNYAMDRRVDIVVVKGAK